MSTTATQFKNLSADAQKVVDAILSLDRNERLSILERIEASLDEDKVTDEQMAMLHRRADEVRQDKVVPIPADEALRML